MIAGGTFYVVRCDYRKWDRTHTCREETAPQRTQQIAVARALETGWQWSTRARDLGLIYCPDHAEAEQAEQSQVCPECSIVGQPTDVPNVLECPGCELSWERRAEP